MSKTAPPPPARCAHVDQVMRAPVTSMERDGHLAGAAYVMHRAGQSALIVVDDTARNRPIAVITEADIARAVAQGRHLDEVRVRELGGDRPVSVDATTTIGDAAEVMLHGKTRELAVVDDGALVGCVSLEDLCRALLTPPESG